MTHDSNQRRSNNFDLLRLGFALMVVGVHIYVLSGERELRFLAKLMSSEWAVKSFFVISGFLVTMSYARSSALRTFAIKRVRRIYPAYVTVILVWAAAGLFLSDLGPGQYLMSGKTWAYLVANFSFLNFLEPTLPGVFGDPALNTFVAPGGGSPVNGSLWSIRTEVACYIAVPFLCAMTKRMQPIIVYGGAYVLCIGFGQILSYYQNYDPRLMLIRVAFPDQFSCFIAGSLVFYYRTWFLKWCRPMLIPVLLVFLFHRSFPDLHFISAWLTPAAIAVLVLWAGLAFPYLGNFARFGDFSYGVYIYHFPIIQMLIALGLYRNQPIFAAILTLALSLAAAAASWHLIEKRWLRRDSHYIQASEQHQEPDSDADLEADSNTDSPPKSASDS
jgi:peptidoglycan/LPS O-acetylase OafA/YrhL